MLKEAAKKNIAKGEVYEVELPDIIELPKVSLDLIYLKEHLTKVDKEFIKRYITEKNPN